MGLTSFFGKHRWDSSDPDRAPPPLPLNPGSASPVTNKRASSTIAAAAEALSAKSRESLYTTNPLPNKSPEKSLIKGQYHKRMQSLQTSNGTIRDLSLYLENGRSSERSPERSPRASISDENRSPDRNPTRSGSATPTQNTKDMAKDIPNLRPTPRPQPRAILGESSPTSATMLALQNTPPPRSKEAALTDIATGPSALVRTPHSIELVSSQILSLTTIATNLQREMAQLSRRSKDNAADLLSLKETTKERDEDIRKNLRDLVSNVSLQKESDKLLKDTSDFSRNPASYLLDNKPHHTSPNMVKSFSLPRIPSPASFAATIEREINSTPSPYSIEGAASIALMEKILREMGTKEGQERLVKSLSEIKQSSSIRGGTDPTVVKKLEEILKVVSESESRALVSRKQNGVLHDNGPQLQMEFDKGIGSQERSRELTPLRNLNQKENHQFSSPKGKDFVNEDLEKALKRIKDSIMEGGGLSAEIKALVRELRGEVLGMGREIGRKLEQAESARSQSEARKDARGPGREEITHIVQQGLIDLKEHMDRVMRERRRESSASAASRSIVDVQEVYHAVKHAISEMPPPQQITVQEPNPGIQRDEILEAVREAWETYKPEIELQNFGLERDEILQCLKEGLHEYRPQKTESEVGATYDEVLDAVHEGLKHFKPPPVETEASATKEEVLEVVRECLESIEFPAPPLPPPREPEITKEDVLEAVREGLSTQPPMSREVEVNREDLFEAVRAGLEGVPMPRDVEVNRDDLFDAVKAGLEGVPTPMHGIGEQVLEKMQDLIDGMRSEFKQYSSANGRDTEQVLDAMKDGLESLRKNIESYVDRAADVTGKDEIIETVKDSLENLRIDLEGTIAEAPRNPAQNNNGEILDSLEKEFEHLRQTIATNLLRNGSSGSDKDEILDAMRDGFEEMRSSVPRNATPTVQIELIEEIRGEFEKLRENMGNSIVPSGSSLDKEEILEALHQGLEGIRSNVDRSNDRPESIHSNTSDLMDAFQDGLVALRVDLEKLFNKPTDMTVNYEILETLKDGISGIRADLDRLQATQAEYESLSGKKGGEVVIADGTAREMPEEADHVRRDDIANLEVLITQLRIKVEALDNMPPPPAESPVNAVETVAIKTSIEALGLTIKELQASITALAEREHSFDANIATKDDTNALETLLINTKAHLEEMVLPETEGMARTEHLDSIDGIVRDTRSGVEHLATRLEEQVPTKDDLALLEAVLKEIQTGVDGIVEKSRMEEGEERVTKADIETLGTLCMETKIQLGDMAVPDFESLTTKVDTEALAKLIGGFRGEMEADAALTAQAFEARKIEHGGIADKIEEVRLFLDDVRHELKSKVAGNKADLEGLAQKVDSVNDAVFGLDDRADIKELFDTVNREFERLHGSNEAQKAETEQNNTTFFEKHEEHKANIITGLSSKIDSRFDEFMLKYDDAQIVAETKEAAFAEKTAQQSEAMDKTRAVAEDLKVLVDTLGRTMTESCERMGEDSKTVFGRVDDIHNRLDTSMSAILTDHKDNSQTLRAELSKTLVAVEGVQAHASEYHPKILDAISDVLNIIGHHFEQTQRSTEEIKTSVNALPSAFPLPAITEALPSPTIEREMPEFEKYDDTEVHAKLDKLTEHVSDHKDQIAEVIKSAAQLEALEQIKAEVAANAAKFDQFVTSQQALVVENQENRAREAEEISIALEKRTAQKENVEADIVRLSEERASLNASVEAMRQEHQEMLNQKSKLQADLASLHTALDIRREEMQLMESRAETLEKRILDGILDHSRSLLITSKPPPNLDAMNRKRVTSTSSNASSISRASSQATTIPSAISSSIRSTVSSGLGMALKRQKHGQQALSPSKSHTPKSDRRIMSLSTVSGNSNRGVPSNNALVLANPSNAFSSGGLKRSHSVKSNFPTRKTSWGGTKQIGMYGDNLDEEEDKENSNLDEIDEDSSDGGTERRTSFMTSSEDRRDSLATVSDRRDSAVTASERRSSNVTTSERRGSDATETASHRSTSYSGTELGTGSYGTGSYGTGSLISRDDDEAASIYGDSTVGTVGLKDQESDPSDSEDDADRSFSDAHLEHSPAAEDHRATSSIKAIENSEVPYAFEGEEEGGQDEERGLELYQGDTGLEKVGKDEGEGRSIFALPSDSGIGTDLPTVDLEAREGYFREKDGF